MQTELEGQARAARPADRCAVERRLREGLVLQAARVQRLGAPGQRRAAESCHRRHAESADDEAPRLRPLRLTPQTLTTPACSTTATATSCRRRWAQRHVALAEGPRPRRRGQRRRRPPRGAPPQSWTSAQLKASLVDVAKGSRGKLYLKRQQLLELGQHAHDFLTELVHKKPRTWKPDVERLYDLAHEWLSGNASTTASSAPSTWRIGSLKQELNLLCCLKGTREVGPQVVQGLGLELDLRQKETLDAARCEVLKRVPRRAGWPERPTFRAGSLTATRLVPIA